MSGNEIERSVIAATLYEPESIIKVSGKIRPRHFQDRDLQMLWKIILDLDGTNSPIDKISIYEIWSKEGDGKRKALLLTEIDNEKYSAAKIEYYAAILIDRYILRKIVEKYSKIITEAKKEATDAFELAEKAIAETEIILSESSGIKEEKNFYSLLENIIDRIKEERDSEVSPGLKSFEFPTFNKATGGLMPGNVVAISGYFKKGKTTFATALLLDMAINGKIPAGMISLEVGFYELALKILSMRAGVKYEYLRNPSRKSETGGALLKDEHIDKLITEINRQFPGTKLFISDEVLDEVKMIAKIKLWVKKHNLKLVMIDYLSLVSSARRYKRHDLEVANVSRSLKLLAKELGIVLIIISQENKEGDMSESKALSRDADFWFSIEHPADNGDVIQIGDETISADNSYFVVEFIASRHSQNGGSFLCKYFETGEFKEIDVRYAGDYGEFPI